MHPLVRGAAAVAVLTAIGGFDRGAPEPLPRVEPPAAARGVDGLPAPCGPGTLPEGPVCIRIPEGIAAPASSAPVHAVERSARGFDEIPRRPERPAEASGYVFPIGSAEHPPRVIGGFEAPAPIRSFASAPERGGVHLAARPGEKVALVTLEHQEGQAEVVFAGDLFGPTVVTSHAVREGAGLVTYLLFHGRLDRVDPAAAVGAKLDAGAPLGFARAAEGGGLIEVYVEARQLREGVALGVADEKRLTDAAVTIPIDLRNVLARR